MTIEITKNRGWRGLAEVILWDDLPAIKQKAVFSFSSIMWVYLHDGCVAIPQLLDNKIIVIEFENYDKLPKGQRSVLIKHFIAPVKSVNTYDIDYITSRKAWDDKVSHNHIWVAYHTLQNKNNHTTSIYNMVGLRVDGSI